MARRATASTQIQTPSALAWRGLVVGGVLIASVLLLLGNGWGLIGRLDGDAFVVVLPFDPRHAGTVDALAEFMVGALAQPIVSRGVTARTGASIGVAGFEPGCRDIEGLLRRATMAMHAAKKAGR